MAEKEEFLDEEDKHELARRLEQARHFLIYSMVNQTQKHKSQVYEAFSTLTEMCCSDICIISVLMKVLRQGRNVWFQCHTPNYNVVVAGGSRQYPGFVA
jgi:hypothetical protein